jgi:hypothetical protein
MNQSYPPMRSEDPKEEDEEDDEDELFTCPTSFIMS